MAKKKQYGLWRVGFVCQKCKNDSDPSTLLPRVCPDCGAQSPYWKVVSCRDVYIRPWWYCGLISVVDSVEIRPDDPQPGDDEYTMPPRIPVEDTET